MSRTIKFAKAGGLDVPQFIETPLPALARTKFVKFKAIGISRAESMWPKDATR